MLSFGIGARTSRQQEIGKNKNEANAHYFSMKMIVGGRAGGPKASCYSNSN